MQYETWQKYAPIIALACMAYVTISQIWLRVTLRKLHRQQKAVNDARRKYAHELNEFIRVKSLLDNNR